MSSWSLSSYLVFFNQSDDLFYMISSGRVPGLEGYGTVSLRTVSPGWAVANSVAQREAHRLSAQRTTRATGPEGSTS